MAKRQRNQLVRTAFHYLVKQIPNQDDPDDPHESGFTQNEFARLLARLRDTAPLDDNDPEVVLNIKTGRDLPFIYHNEPQNGLHFGDFEGAYYGQRYRNNVHGEISADSLNLRRFHYLVTRLRDGKIVVGTTYHGQFGDYDGLRSCFSHILRGDYKVASKTLKNVSNEIGEGHAVSLKLSYRKKADRIERRPLFGTTGEIAVKKSDFGPDFEETVDQAARRIRGSDAQRKRILAQIVNEADMLEIDDDEIIGCSAVIRENGRQRTVYFVGENNFSTKYPLNVDVDVNGVGNRDQIRAEMVRILRAEILPIINNAQPN